MTDASRPSPIGPRATHGIRATYSRGCRCDECRAAWREARRVPVREWHRRRRAAELATHPDGCMCIGCRRNRGELKPVTLRDRDAR